MQPLRVTAILPRDGLKIQSPGYIRVILPLLHRDLKKRICLKIENAELFLKRGLGRITDVLLVQRNAIPPHLTVPILKECEKENIGIVFDIDDNLFDLPEESKKAYQPWMEPLKLLANNADLLTPNLPDSF